MSRNFQLNPLRTSPPFSAHYLLLDGGDEVFSKRGWKAINCRMGHVRKDTLTRCVKWWATSAGGNATNPKRNAGRARARDS